MLRSLLSFARLLGGNFLLWSGTKLLQPGEALRLACLRLRCAGARDDGRELSGRTRQHPAHRLSPRPAVTACVLSEPGFVKASSVTAPKAARGDRGKGSGGEYGAGVRLAAAGRDAGAQLLPRRAHPFSGFVASPPLPALSSYLSRRASPPRIFLTAS